MNKELKLRTKEEFRTMTDPYRIDIVQVFRKNPNTPMTVKDIAVALGEPHGKVYYHMKKMLNIGALSLVKTEKINGITAKYYKLSFSSLSFDSEDDETAKVMAYNHAKVLVTKLFDDSKKGVLKMIDLEPEELSAGQKKSDVSAVTLHFTDEKLEAFTRELHALIHKYEQEEALEDTYKKTFFHALYSE